MYRREQNFTHPIPKWQRHAHTSVYDDLECFFYLFKENLKIERKKMSKLQIRIRHLSGKENSNTEIFTNPLSPLLDNVVYGCPLIQRGVVYWYQWLRARFLSSEKTDLIWSEVSSRPRGSCSSRELDSMSPELFDLLVGGTYIRLE